MQYVYKFADSEIIEDILQLKKLEKFQDELIKIQKEYNSIYDESQKLVEDAYNKSILYKVGIDYKNMEALNFKKWLSDLKSES